MSVYPELVDQQSIHEDNYGQDNVDISQIEAPVHHKIEEHPVNLYEPVKKYSGPVHQKENSIAHHSNTHEDSIYQIPHGTCPQIDSNLKCGYEENECWSPGVPDLDCPGSALCCFNGCINVCLSLPLHNAQENYYKSVEHQEVDIDDYGHENLESNAMIK